MISIIAAVGKNLELGYNNKLIWDIKEDLKYFKETTMGKTVVMGENTFRSIGRILPGRRNIILSLDKIDISGGEVFNDYKKVLSLSDDVFIIGGASIYKLFLPYADKLYLTLINDSAVCDCYFPSFDESLYKKIVIGKNKSNSIEYTFVCYERI